MACKRDNWYTRYLEELPGERSLYDVNRARFIRCMLNCGFSDCEIFTCGYENNLCSHVEIRYDSRIQRDASLIVWKYPPYMRWLEALRDWDCMISKADFDDAFSISLDDKETFLRVFSVWEFVLRNMTRYIMQYEANYGKKAMWNKKMYE